MWRTFFFKDLCQTFVFKGVCQTFGQIEATNEKSIWNKSRGVLSITSGEALLNSHGGQ